MIHTLFWFGIFILHWFFVFLFSFSFVPAARDSVSVSIFGRFRFSELRLLAIEMRANQFVQPVNFNLEHLWAIANIGMGKHTNIHTHTQAFSFISLTESEPNRFENEFNYWPHTLEKERNWKYNIPLHEVFNRSHAATILIIIKDKLKNGRITEWCKSDESRTWARTLNKLLWSYLKCIMHYIKSYYYAKGDIHDKHVEVMIREFVLVYFG